MTFYLRREWVDQEDGIDEVEIHYATVAADREPAEGHHQCRQMLPETDGGRRRRAKVIQLPRALDGHERYSLSYYFLQRSSAGDSRSPTFVEEIVADGSYTFLDWQGDYTNICVYWSIGGWGAPNFSSMFVDGIPLHHPLSSLHFYGNSHDDGWMRARLELLDSMELPHVYRGRVHGPRGAKVVWCYHIMRRGDTAGRDYDFWDNNNGLDYTAVLGGD